MADRPTFQEQQYAFAAHIRDPENAPAPEGIEDRRMAVYRELFFNNISNLLGTMFPVLRKIHSNAQWRRFIRQFMRRHTAQTPYFLRLPEEFLAFLQHEFEPDDEDFPFLVELAHYEYVELALSVCTDEDDLSNIDPGGDLIAGVPHKSVLAWTFAYQYPVHRISPSFLPTEPSPAWLALYRDNDDKVQFLELNAVTAALLESVGNNETGATGRQLLRNLAEQIHYPDAEALVRHGEGALREMRQLGIVTGTLSNR